MSSELTCEELQKQRRGAMAKHWRNLATAMRAAGSIDFAEKCEVAADELERPRLGDSIKAVTDALGIPQCGGCKRRQAALNAVDTSKPLGTVVKDVFKALIS